MTPPAVPLAAAAPATSVAAAPAEAASGAPVKEGGQLMGDIQFDTAKPDKAVRASILPE